MTQKTNCLEIKKRKEKKKIKMMITKGKIEKTAKKKKKKKKKKKSEQNFLGRSYSAPNPVRVTLNPLHLKLGPRTNWEQFLFCDSSPRPLCTRWAPTITNRSSGNSVISHNKFLVYSEFLNTGKGWRSFFWLRVQLTFQTQMRGNEPFKELTGTI